MASTTTAAAAAALQAKPIIGVIGGSGLYKLQGLKVIQQIDVKTVGAVGRRRMDSFFLITDPRPRSQPWGSPSSPITISETPSGVPIAFLARHGFTHHITPSGVPNLANIAALKSIGVRFIVAFTAVGSLREEIRPRDFVVPDQLFDRTKGIRRSSFFGYDNEEGVVAHAGMGQPYDAEVRQVVEDT